MPIEDSDLNPYPKARAQMALAEVFHAASLGSNGSFDPRKKGFLNIKCYDAPNATGNMLSDVTIPITVWDPAYDNAASRVILEDTVFTSHLLNGDGLYTPSIDLYCSCSENVYDPTAGQDRNPIIDLNWPIGENPADVKAANEFTSANALLDEVGVTVQGGSTLAVTDIVSASFDMDIILTSGTKSVFMYVTSSYGSFSWMYSSSNVLSGRANVALEFSYGVYRNSGNNIPATAGVPIPDIIAGNIRLSAINAAGTPYLFEDGQLSAKIDTTNAESIQTCNEIANRLISAALESLIPTEATVMGTANPGWSTNGVIQCMNTVYSSASPSGIAHNSSISHLQEQIDNIVASDSLELDSMYLRG